MTGSAKSIRAGSAKSIRAGSAKSIRAGSAKSIRAGSAKSIRAGSARARVLGRVPFVCPFPDFLSRNCVPRPPAGSCPGLVPFLCPFPDPLCPFPNGVSLSRKVSLSRNLSLRRSFRVPRCPFPYGVSLSLALCPRPCGPCSLYACRYPCVCVRVYCVLCNVYVCVSSCSHRLNKESGVSPSPAVCPEVFCVLIGL